MATASLSPSEQLQARLAEPRTVEALNRLLDRLDVLAFSAEMMDSFFRRSSEVADSVADSVAEVRQLAKNETGSDFLDKIPAFARAGVRVAETTTSPAFERLLESGLLERLAEPRTIESLKSLLDQLEVAAFSLQALDGFLRRADVIANSIADSVEEIRGRAPVESGSLVEKLPQLAATGAQLAEVAQKPEFNNLLSLVDKVGKPETIEKLGALLDKLDLAVFALNAMDGVLRRGPEVTDSMAAGLGELRKLAPELDIDNLQQLASDMVKLLQAGRRLAASGLLDKLDELSDAGLTLSEAGMFDKQVVTALGEVGRLAAQSYWEAKKVPAKRVGVLGMMRLLNDPAAQPAFNLLTEATRRFGDKIK
jgi:uncharacterized protein YjgD (DUF1641 family)